MVEVTKDGREKVYVARCGKCASDLKYSFSDVKMETVPGIYSALRKMITCPVCGEILNVNMMTAEDVEKAAKTAYPSAFNSCVCG